MNLNRLLRAPGAGLLLRPWYDRAAMRALRRWYFPLSRAWAAALAAGKSREDFAREVPCAPPPAGLTDSALAATFRLNRAYERARREWEDAFFGPARAAPGRLRDAESARIAAAHALMSARAHFLPLQAFANFPPVRFEVADGDTVRRHHGARLAEGRTGFPAPAPLPAFERSRLLENADSDAFWLRFPSPGRVGDVAWARAFLPEGAKPRATVVLAHGVAMETEFWRGLAAPYEALSASGICTIAPEGPFHGRRRRDGRYGGEDVFSLGVLGLLDYFEAHVAELAALVAWARAEFGGPVALVGISLGAFAAQLAAVACRGWPADMRPDALLLVAAGGSLLAAAFEGTLAQALGIPTALRTAGWGHEDLVGWLPLLEARGAPALPPERIVATLGRADDIAPYAEGRALMRAWDVPEENVFVRDQGHFTASLGLFADDAPLRRLADLLLAAP
ncbi:MAG TPA: alpha/beta fold hydrolase [Alphaproteobacteria bacterium]|nr:alpha/beta fold hydrolase [Alphaproteobacteria bacterium]